MNYIYNIMITNDIINIIVSYYMFESFIIINY